MLMFISLAVNPLDQLHDIKPPDAVSIWPLAPGWWLLLCLLVLLLTSLGLFAAKRLPQVLWRHRALQALPRVTENAHYFGRLNAWLKQAASHYYPDADTEALSGKSWVDFLHSKAPDLSKDDLERITQSALMPTPQITPAAAETLAIAWLRRQPCSR